MENNVAWTILVTILSSSAVYGFIQFLVTRHDAKNDKFETISKQLTSVDTQLGDIKTKITVDIAEVYDKIEDLRDNQDKQQAIAARIRILQASDEMRHGVQHSEEFFDQIHEDITVYENYCKNNVKFKNNKAVQAIQNINRVYQECLAENKFL